MLAFDEKSFKIIIVDEHTQFRNTLASRLRMEGYHVEVAAGGFHLLHTLEKRWDYHLIIIHEDCADMPAEEMIQLVRLHKTKSELPILFISGPSSEEEIRELVFQGANEFIVRPTSPQPILDRAKKYFSLIKNP